MAPLGFLAPVLPSRALRSSTSSRAHAAPRCSLPEVEKAFPSYLRNAAPHISFDGEKGISMSMKRVEAFTEETNAGPLFDYDDEKDWSSEKPAGNPVAWPAGDGRDAAMTGTRGSFNVGDDKVYKEFPPGGFFKRSMDG